MIVKIQIKYWISDLRENCRAQTITIKFLFRKPSELSYITRNCSMILAHGSIQIFWVKKNSKNSMLDSKCYVSYPYATQYEQWNFVMMSLSWSVKHSRAQLSTGKHYQKLKKSNLRMICPRENFSKIEASTRQLSAVDVSVIDLS